VRKKEEDHKQMIQQLSDSLPPEPASGSPGVCGCMCICTRVHTYICISDKHAYMFNTHGLVFTRTLLPSERLLVISASGCIASALSSCVEFSSCHEGLFAYIIALFLCCLIDSGGCTLGLSSPNMHDSITSSDAYNIHVFVFIYEHTSYVCICIYM